MKSKLYDWYLKLFRSRSLDIDIPTIKSKLIVDELKPKSCIDIDF